MSIQSQLDQVLALVDQFALTGRANWTHPKREVFANELRSRLSEIRAAVGGEAVAWRRVHVWPDGKRRGPHGPWRDIAERVDEQHGDSIEYAYASPPATVDVGALRELVESWRSAAKRTRQLAGKSQRRGADIEADVRFSAAQDAEAYADELAALIGEKA